MIGRVADINGFKAKVAAIGITRRDLLEMDKWTPVVNDCWVLGGVHRRAAFRLESPRALDNLWEGARGDLVAHDYDSLAAAIATGSIACRRRY